MIKAATALLVIWAASVGAQQIRKVPIEASPAGNGKAMFGQYCAACHGLEGRGDGPAATALVKRPADLTQLARKNNGKFPELQVMNFITGGEVVAAHGTRDMPVWGQLFEHLNPQNAGVPQLRVRNLMEYIKTLQAQ